MEVTKADIVKLAAFLMCLLSATLRGQTVTDTCDYLEGGILERQMQTGITGLIRGTGFCIQPTTVNGGLEMVGATLSVVDGDTTGQVLRWTGTDWVPRLIIFPTVTGGVDTAYNGLTDRDTAFVLGGPLVEHTTVTGQQTYDFFLNNMRNIALEGQRTGGVAYTSLTMGSTAAQGVDFFHYNEASPAKQAVVSINYSTGNVMKIQETSDNGTGIQQYDNGGSVFRTDIYAANAVYNQTFRIDRYGMYMLYPDIADATNEAAFLMIDTATYQVLRKSPADFTGLYGDDWGSQVVEKTARFSGSGTTGSPLELAQQSATSGQVLKWSGTVWAPGTDANTNTDSTWIKTGGSYANKRITDAVKRTASATAPFYDMGGSEFNVAAYGITPGADETTDFLKLLDTLKARGGGRIVFNPGEYIFTGKILVPSIAQAQTRNGATVHRNVDMVWQGAGAYAAGYSNQDTFQQKGTLITLTYAGDSLGRIDTRGLGKIAIRDITFDGGGSTTTPLFKTSNTTLDVSNCAFMNAGDVFQLGSNGTPTEYWSNGPTECFQGYGSVFKNNYFNQVATGFYLKENANGIVIRDNTFWWQCNGYAAIRIEPTGAVSGGNSISNNLIEMNGYQYGIVLGKTAGNTIVDNNFFDADGTTTALIYHKNYPYVNSIRMGFYSGGTITQFVDDAADGITHYFPMLSDDTARVASPHVFYAPAFLTQDSFSIHDSGADGYYWEKAAGSNTLKLGMDLAGGGIKEIVSFTKNTSGSVIQAYDVDNTDIRVQADGTMYYAAKEYATLNDSIFTYADTQTAIEKDAGLIVSSEAATPGDPTGYGTGIEIRPLYNRSAFASIGAVYETSNPNDNVKLTIHQKGGGTANKRAEFGSDGTVLFSGASTSQILSISNPGGESSFFRDVASPTGVISGNPGDVALTNQSGVGKMYLKESGTGSTGWGQVATGVASNSYATFTVTRNLPTSVGNTIEIGVVKRNGDANFYHLTVVGEGSANAVSKKYIIPSHYDATDASAGLWQSLLPIASTGAYFGRDFEVEMRSNGSNDTLRIRKTGHTGAATATAVIELFAFRTGETFVETSNTRTSPAAAAQTYQSSAISQQANKVGINVLNPVQSLHVAGTARITGSDGTATGLMGRDADGDISAVGVSVGLEFSGGNIQVEMGSGLNVSGNAVAWGGTLTENTTVDVDVYDLNFVGLPTATTEEDVMLVGSGGLLVKGTVPLSAIRAPGEATYLGANGATGETVTWQPEDVNVDADPTAGHLTVELNGGMYTGVHYSLFGCCNLTYNIILSGTMKLTGEYGTVSSYTLTAGQHLEVVKFSDNSFRVSKK